VAQGEGKPFDISASDARGGGVGRFFGIPVEGGTHMVIRGFSKVGHYPAGGKGSAKALYARKKFRHWTALIGKKKRHLMRGKHRRSAFAGRGSHVWPKDNRLQTEEATKFQNHEASRTRGGGRREKFIKEKIPSQSLQQGGRN